MVDLELGEVDEDLFHIGPRESVVFDQLSLEEASKATKGLRQSHVATIDVDAFNLVAHDDRLRNDCDYSLCCLWRCINLVSLTVVNQLSTGNLLSHQSQNVWILTVKEVLWLLDLNRVAMTVLGFEVIGGAKDNEPAVNHDSDTVTELLSLIHAMCSQQHRSHVHLLDHAVEGSTWDWVHSTSWLIEEEHLGAEHKSLSAAQFPLVASTKVFRYGISEEVEVKVIHNEAFDTLSSITTDTFQAGNEVHAFIHCECFPNQVFLVALTKEFAHGLEREVLDIVTHKFSVTRCDR